MLKPIERKLQDGRGVYPGAPGSANEPKLGIDLSLHSNKVSGTAGLVVFDGNDGTGFASMLRKALLKHSASHRRECVAGGEGE